MSIFDVILLILLFGFIFYGLFFGLIRTVGSVLAVIIGTLAASIFYPTAYQLVEGIFPGHEVIGKTITFLVILLIANRLVGFLVMILDRTFDLLTIIPFLKTINRLAGAAFGLFLGSLVLGLFLYAFKFMPPYFPNLSEGFKNSEFAPYLISFIVAIKPLLPGVLNSLKSLALSNGYY